MISWRLRRSRTSSTSKHNNICHFDSNVFVLRYSQFINFNIFQWASKTEEVEEEVEEEEKSEKEDGAVEEEAEKKTKKV